MIHLVVVPLAKGCAVTLDGLGGWAVFELDRTQTLSLRDQLTAVLDAPDTKTLADLIAVIGR